MNIDVGTSHLAAAAAAVKEGKGLGEAIAGTRSIFFDIDYAVTDAEVSQEFSGDISEFAMKSKSESRTSEPLVLSEGQKKVLPFFVSIDLKVAEAQAIQDANSRTPYDEPMEISYLGRTKTIPAGAVERTNPKSIEEIAIEDAEKFAGFMVKQKGVSFLEDILGESRSILSCKKVIAVSSKRDVTEFEIKEEYKQAFAVLEESYVEIKAEEVKDAAKRKEVADKQAAIESKKAEEIARLGGDSFYKAFIELLPETAKAAAEPIEKYARTIETLGNELAKFFEAVETIEKKGVSDGDKGELLKKLIEDKATLNMSKEKMNEYQENLPKKMKKRLEEGEFKASDLVAAFKVISKQEEIKSRANLKKMSGVEEAIGRDLKHFHKDVRITVKRQLNTYKRRNSFLVQTLEPLVGKGINVGEKVVLGVLDMAASSAGPLTPVTVIANQGAQLIYKLCKKSIVKHLSASSIFNGINTVWNGLQDIARTTTRVFSGNLLKKAKKISKRRSKKTWRTQIQSKQGKSAVKNPILRHL
jgi:hypothetical protein